MAGLIGWLLLTFLAPVLGVFAKRDGWYAGLRKPEWTPPGWVVGPVWTVLYTLMAVAAWMVWRRGGFAVQRVALGWFLVQLVFNAAWTPLFFGAHRPDLAFFDVVLLWGSIVGTLLSFYGVHSAAGWLLVPYLLWVSFAAVLNFTLWRMNP